jgi:TATA-box binding protein (TBP) (component of TFIID and TFIIIB)
MVLDFHVKSLKRSFLYVKKLQGMLVRDLKHSITVVDLRCMIHLEALDMSLHLVVVESNDFHGVIMQLNAIVFQACRNA